MNSNPTTSQEGSGYTSYIFLDESGNLDFSPTGTKYFVLTSVSTVRPFGFYDSLESLKYELLERGWDGEYFHCSDDNKFVKKQIFDIVADHSKELQIDSLIVEKAKTDPALTEDRRFYPEMLGYLLKFVLQSRAHSQAREIIVITDTVPVRKRRRSVESAARGALKAMLPQSQSYRLLHHSSRAHYGLQVADYCCWAIFHKHETQNLDYYQRISQSVHSEFDTFRSGTTYYY